MKKIFWDLATFTWPKRISADFQPACLYPPSLWPTCYCSVPVKITIQTICCSISIYYKKFDFTEATITVQLLGSILSTLWTISTFSELEWYWRIELSFSMRIESTWAMSSRLRDFDFISSVQNVPILNQNKQNFKRKKK